MNSVIDLFLMPLSPVIAMATAGVSLILVECFPSFQMPRVKTLIAAIGAVAALFFCWKLVSQESLAVDTSAIENSARWLFHFTKNYRLDRLSLAFYSAISVFTLFSIVFIAKQFERSDLKSEILSLVLFGACGMMLLVSANSLLMIFMGLELLSLPTYVLVGIQHRSKEGCEAALKYFLFGSFATVLIVLAVALLYAQFSTLSLPLLREAMGTPSAKTPLAYCGIALFCIAVAFKVGTVPFHMWLPDAYQGAPSSVTGFMGSAIKLAGFGLALRLFWDVFVPSAAIWSPVLIGLAVVSMFVGNLAALVQEDVKRMFAYSSISHAGYLMLGVAASTSSGSAMNAIYYYLVIYGLMFVGMMACVQIVERETGSTELHSLSGLGFQRPFLGLCMAIFTVSAAGIPPTAGFFAKYFVFFEAFRAGHYLAVVLALLSSLVGVYFYLRVLVFLYMKEGRERGTEKVKSIWVYSAIGLCALSMLVFAFSPQMLRF